VKFRHSTTPGGKDPGGSGVVNIVGGTREHVSYRTRETLD
jgi:hypothetical protein